ncbi:HAMP domain-containing protein [Streptomyces sp. NPDC049954]|uniref:cache domain-containing protein n=1 Tax=Streptomyces sp. NPDC049954 TaxID=3155779 RepID=UPI0034352698
MSLLGGIRPPIAVLSVLLLALAGVTALTLGRVDQTGLPKAVRVSQQHFAEDGAIALRASIDESVTDLDRSAALFNAGRPVDADTVLDKLGSVYQKWTGTAVVEISSGKLLAARGENLPLTAVDLHTLGDENGLAPRMVRLQNGETRLLAFALLNWAGKPQQLMVASSSLKFPGISLGKFRSIAVVDPRGAVLSSDGIPQPEQLRTDRQRSDAAWSTKQLKAVARTAATQARRKPSTTKEPGSGGFLGVSGWALGGVRSGERAVAGYASLAAPQPGETTVATGLGLSVVAVAQVAEDNAARAHPAFGLLAAGALLVIGALAVAVLLATVQRPLLRLFLESRRLTRGDLARPVRVPRRGEAARIGTALERIRRQLRGESDTDIRPARHRFGTRTLLVVCALLLLAWSLPLMLLLNRPGQTVVVPQQLVSDQRERTDTLSDRVRRALNEGHADLASVAQLIGDRTPPAEMSQVLSRTMAEHHRYESLYVLDDSGRVLARTGADPHTTGHGPSDKPLGLLSTTGKKPVIVGTAEIPGRAGAAVVGELRIDFLNSLLKRPGLGTVRIVDEDRRVIGGNDGYLAFQRLPAGRLDTLVEGTSQKAGLSAHANGVLYRGGEDGIEIAAAAPFAGGGAAKALRWSVVSWQPASHLAIPAYSVRSRTVLAGLLGLTAAAACLGWLQIVVVRPLRALAQQAEALADGDRRTVLFPRHHDEVGAVTRSLELLRQQTQARQRRRDGVPSPAGRN